ncbi:hypothetical protein EJB05_13046, partial [Eragrostis curvula]
MSSWRCWAASNSFSIFTSRGNSTAPPTGGPLENAVEAGSGHNQYPRNAGALDGGEAGAHHQEEARRRVFLTWEDLSVTAAGRKGSRAVILDGLTGYARPGHVLALMGPSGCGKTTLLDTLAGRLGSNMKATGDILINGRREKLAFGTSAYVTQDDLLMATLTVTEAVQYSAQLQLPDTVPPAEKRARAERAIRQMGLAAVASNRIGGRVCKGISGGQRRREEARRRVFLTWEDLSVTAAGRKGSRAVILDGLTGYARPGHVLALMGPSGCGKTTLLDTLAGRLGSNMKATGDILINGRREKLAFGTSAYVTQDDLLMATLTVTEAVQYSAQLQLPDTVPPAEKRARAERAIRQMGLAAVASNRIGGRVCKGISGGQRRRFFGVNGFPCPLRRNPSDYFLTLINKDFEESNEEGRTLDLPSAAKVIETLVESIRSSGGYRINKETCSADQDASLIKKTQATFLAKSIVLTKRSLVNMHRDTGYYWLRFIIYIALCVSIGTIFFNVGSKFASIQARASMIMFTSTFITMMSIGGFPSFVEDMKIFRKEHLNGHYGATPFVTSNTLSSTPYLGLICIVPGAIAYYLTGLQRGIDHFVYFVVVIWACTMLVEGLMMIVAAIVPDFLLGIITGSGIQGMLMLNAGFFRLPSDLPKPIWRYPTYYISYHKYATQGLYKNEFLGLIFEDPGGGGLTISGEYILKNYLEVEMGYSKWVDLAILLAMVFIYRVLFLVIIKVAEKVKPLIKCLAVNV